MICSGTYLHGRTIIGECIEESGPDGMHAATALTERLLALGLPLRRFKTGTPPRVNARTVDFSKMELQEGDPSPLPFSFETETPPENRAVCYLTYTNEETHRIIRENLDRSPIYSGVIEGIGPRYCPSIETKVVRFADKPRHGVERRPDQFVARRPQLFDQRLALTRNVLLQLAALAVEVGESVVHRSVHRPDELRGLPVQLLQHVLRQVHARAQEEMVGVREDDAGAKVAQLIRRDALDGRLRADRHEDWCREAAVRRVDDACARPRELVLLDELICDSSQIKTSTFTVFLIICPDARRVLRAERASSAQGPAPHPSRA